MNSVIGETLPLAVGIAISPIPIIAVILMLMTPRAKSVGLAFLGGWLVGIVVAVAAFTALAGVIPEPQEGSARPIEGVIQLVLGVALALLAVRQWRSRPQPGEEAELPRWMSAIDSVRAGKAFGLGMLLAALNPKNLGLAIAAGVAIGHAGLDTASIVVAVAVFVAVAACSVAVPVVAYLIAPEGSKAMLDGLRVQLVAHNAMIMTVLFAVLAAQLVGKGLGQF